MGSHYRVLIFINHIITPLNLELKTLLENSICISHDRKWKSWLNKGLSIGVYCLLTSQNIFLRYQLSTEIAYKFSWLHTFYFLQAYREHIPPLTLFSELFWSRRRILTDVLQKWYKLQSFNSVLINRNY